MASNITRILSPSQMKKIRQEGERIRKSSSNPGNGISISLAPKEEQK